jgi:hypothetical protein
MAVELQYINADGLTGTLRQSPPFFIKKIDGTGDVHNLIGTFKAPDQDGAFFINATLDTRLITIEGTIIADNTDKAHVLRNQLLRLFTPKVSGTLIYRDKKINCVVEDIKLAVTSRQRVPGFIISLLCPSPYFEAIEPIRAELAQWIPLMMWPLEIPTETGFMFGMRQPSQIMTLINPGDAPTGCQITFSALGNVTNPELMDVDTGEFIRIMRTMVGGEKIHVYTHFAGKRVISEYNGITTNVFNTLDPGSTFLQLAVGTNMLRYDAEEGIDLLEVSVIHPVLFNGV